MTEPRISDLLAAIEAHTHTMARAAARLGALADDLDGLGLERQSTTVSELALEIASGLEVIERIVGTLPDTDRIDVS